MKRPVMIVERDALRDEVHQLAEDAFHHHLISGHGDGEYPDQYQIVYQGKPRHVSLKEAHDLLEELLEEVT